MIPDSSLAAISDTQKVPNWRLELAQAIKSVDELVDFLELKLSPEQLAAAHKASQQFPIRASHSFLSRIQKGQLNDPLLKQILPIEEELKTQSGYCSDAVGDLNAMPTPGLLQKYSGRALLITTGACGIHCRYCFRREFPYSEASSSKSHWDHCLDYLQRQQDISEVILSGGDPLMLSDKRLLEMSTELAKIPHLKRLRLHSRMPIIVPSRITDELILSLCNTRLKAVMVVHANHAQEIDSHVQNGIERLSKHSIPVLNQAVLLRGINDTVDSQANLSESLFQAHILPYYLHLLDQVNGTHHFEVSAESAIALIESLRKRLPGYLVPKLVKEKAGAASKLPIL